MSKLSYDCEDFAQKAQKKAVLFHTSHIMPKDRFQNGGPCCGLSSSVLWKLLRVSSNIAHI